MSKELEIAKIGFWGVIISALIGGMFLLCNTLITHKLNEEDQEGKTQKFISSERDTVHDLRYVEKAKQTQESISSKKDTIHKFRDTKKTKQTQKFIPPEANEVENKRKKKNRNASFNVKVHKVGTAFMKVENNLINKLVEFDDENGIANISLEAGWYDFILLEPDTTKVIREFRDIKINSKVKEINLNGTTHKIN